MAQTPDHGPADPHAAPTTVHDTHATTEAEHGSGGGLPQFEFQHWFGQIVYLVFLFALLYLLIAKVFAPRMRRIFDQRAETIETAIATARRVQAEADAQADAARAGVAQARAEALRTATEAKARVTEDLNRRQAAAEGEAAAKVAEAEAAIAKTREAAMAGVSQIAAETAQAVVEKLTGKAATKAELDAALKGAA
ncbi:hypothetical protein Q0812_03250 [Brevundimonas sp. 2R-24]|uniref:ATP synthase subunit b n=1 Tax=Peiella sedimenti TaxID=3061083 RepID=A0ABT8SME2_9CAUL|nr:hypothetical protein [Caulobacteraceae bacterium XZ-24]